MTRGQATGFVVLCLWSSAAWFTADLLPGRLGAMEGQGVRFLLIGLLALLFQAVRRRKVPERFLSSAGWGAAGVGLIGVPLLLLDISQSMSVAVPGVVVFALVPVTVVAGTGRMPLLIPALAGVAGVLLLVPSRLPSSAAGWEGLGLTVLAAGATGVWLVVLRRLLREVELAWAVTVICLGSGVLLGLAGLAVGEGGWGWSGAGIEIMRAALLDLPEMVLFLWLVKVVEPHRVAARYLAAPLFTVIEGYVLVRPGLDVRTIAGVALLAGGSWWLLRAEPEERVGLGLL